MNQPPIKNAQNILIVPQWGGCSGKWLVRVEVRHFPKLTENGASLELFSTFTLFPNHFKSGEPFSQNKMIWENLTMFKIFWYPLSK